MQTNSLCDSVSNGGDCVVTVGERWNNCENTAFFYMNIYPARFLIVVGIMLQFAKKNILFVALYCADTLGCAYGWENSKIRLVSCQRTHKTQKMRLNC